MLNIISKSNHKTRWCYLAHHGRKHLNILSGLFHVINRYLINQPFHLFLILVDSGNEICKLFLQNVPYFDVRAYSWNKNTTPNKIFTQFDWFCVISNKMIMFRIKWLQSWELSQNLHPYSLPYLQITTNKEWTAVVNIILW